MKTKTKYNLKELLSAYKNIYYQNSNITKENFPVPEKIETKNWKLIKMEKSFSSQEALEKIKAEGCRPANIYELLLWAKDNQEKSQWVLAFGQLWKDSDGNHRVPVVHRYSDGDWWFRLGVFEGDWNDAHCLLVFSETSEPKTREIPLSKGKNALTLSSKNLIRENLEKIRDLISEIEGML